MKNIVLFTLIFLVFGCSNPVKIEMTKKIEIDWSKLDDSSEYDIKYVQLNFNPFVDEEIMGKGIEELMYKDSIYTLDQTDKSRLIEIISDSLNFSYGECGTFALNAGFVFIKNDTIKGIIEMGCGYYQWGFEPWNKNSMDGSLSDIGFEKMTKMLDDINLKIKKTNAQQKLP
ncbi:hypothetical protein [Reichenbachiella ulvae]|uniref:DUF4136 domain-containing protein n=1 Tax=Reichenbachiella ulvae TaxID=2980104 RepID=A0ABT3CPB4_9BACT|nr:hypothetical protein [Reichenbachiella ulvae]MCV9385457.1 hypothetical protein [Reichenbachiella ulvae]